MENERFQELVIEQLAKMFGELKELRTELKNDVNVIERLDRIEAKIEVLQLETAHVRRQGNKDVHTTFNDKIDKLHFEVEEIEQDIDYWARRSLRQQLARTETRDALKKMQLDINYLVRKTSYHDDEILQLKKSKV